jgi:hypothetical protein
MRTLKNFRLKNIECVETAAPSKLHIAIFDLAAFLLEPARLPLDRLEGVAEADAERH